MMIELWIFGSYCLGTLAGAYMAYHWTHIRAVEKTIDQLILNGFLKSKKVNGQIEIIKADE